VSHPLFKVVPVYLSDETLRISPRLRDALVADLMEEADEEVADWLLSERRRNDEHECTEDLARQLGFRQTYGPVVHDVLMFMLPELDRLLRQWPLPQDNKECAFIVKHATSALRPGETLSLLIAGPPSWSRGPLPEGATYASLPRHCESVAVKGLTASLRGVLDRWDTWNVPALHVQWNEARFRKRAQSTAPTPPVSEAERAQRRADRNRFNRTAGWVPPGRTT
jgi:hypothetical protein